MKNLELFNQEDLEACSNTGSTPDLSAIDDTIIRPSPKSWATAKSPDHAAAGPVAKPVLKASNQLHGKLFEDMIKSSGRYPGSCDHGRASGARFDIEAKFDITHGLPTSVKSSGSNIVELADARAFWKLVPDEPFNLLIGFHRQGLKRKVFCEIIEFILEPNLTELLLGDISYDEVAELHESINLKNIPLGTHKKGRKYAGRKNKVISKRKGLITLNPKIGEGTQRRLQCSINVANLIAHLNPSRITFHETSFAQMALPFSIKSGSRRFRPRKASI